MRNPANAHADRHLDHDGCRITYQVRGDGPPVVFVQGVGVFGNAWAPQIDAFADSYRCLSFDHRGLPTSPPTPRTLTVAQLARDTLALIDAQAWPSAHVVGHSLGGLIAAELALQAPARVRSLALLCTFANGREAATSWRMMWIGARTRIGTRRMRRHAFLELVHAPTFLRGKDRDALAANVGALFGHDLADTLPVVGAQLRAMRTHDVSRQLSRLTGVPTLVVSGAHDPIAPPSLGRKLAEAIQGARFVEFPDAAHGVPIQCAADLNDRLGEHLRAAEARAVAAGGRA